MQRGFHSQKLNGAVSAPRDADCVVVDKDFCSGSSVWSVRRNGTRLCCPNGSGVFAVAVAFTDCDGVVSAVSTVGWGFDSVSGGRSKCKPTVGVG